MMNQAINLVLREREGVVAHPLFANGPIDAMLVLLLDPVEDNGACAEVDVFVADIGRTVAPGIPAAEWPAYQARIRTPVRHRDGGVAAPYRKFIVDQEIGVLGVGYLFESFGHQRLLDGGLHALAIHGIVGIGLLAW